MHLILINACVGVELQGLRVSKCLQSSFFFYFVVVVVVFSFSILSWLIFVRLFHFLVHFLFSSFVHNSYVDTMDICIHNASTKSTIQ